MCAAGPPNAVQLSRRKNTASSRIETFGGDEAECETSRAGCSAMAATRGMPRVERRRSRADEEDHAAYEWADNQKGQ